VQITFNNYSWWKSIYKNDEGQNCRQPPVEENAATYEKIIE